MDYKDTILKQSSIKWKPKLTMSDDGKVDIDIHIPLTDLLDKQARVSFGQGILVAFGFFADKQVEEKVITSEIIKAKFTEWGLPKGIIDYIDKSSKSEG